MKRTCIACGDECENLLCRWCFEAEMHQQLGRTKRKRDFGPLVGAALVLSVGCGFWLLVLWLIGVI